MDWFPLSGAFAIERYPKKSRSSPRTHQIGLVNGKSRHSRPPRGYSRTTYARNWLKSFTSSPFTQKTATSTKSQVATRNIKSQCLTGRLNCYKHAASGRLLSNKRIVPDYGVGESGGADTSRAVRYYCMKPFSACGLGDCPSRFVADPAVAARLLTKVAARPPRPPARRNTSRSHAEQHLGEIRPELSLDSGQAGADGLRCQSGKRRRTNARSRRSGCRRPLMEAHLLLQGIVMESCFTFWIFLSFQPMR